MAIAGTEQVIRQLVENTDQAQFETSIICLDGKVGELGQELIKKGFHIDKLDRTGTGLDIALIKDLRNYIKQNDIRILHCHQYTPYIYGLFASLGTRVPVIFTEHGRFYPDSYKWKRMILNPILSLFTASVTAISKATGEALTKYENFPKRKIQVIYNGIQFDPSSFSDHSNIRTDLGIPVDAKILGTISRLDTIKNQTMMIEAFSDVLKLHPNTYLLIVGDGPERTKLENLTKSLNIESQVIFTGFKVNPQRYFSIIDVFLLSSLSEGTSMTLLEAMAFKKPAVVTNVGGNPEIVKNNETGLVTPNSDRLAFASAINTLFNDSKYTSRLGQACYQRYKQLFTATKMAKEYQTLYNHLAEKY